MSLKQVTLNDALRIARSRDKKTRNQNKISLDRQGKVTIENKKPEQDFKNRAEKWKNFSPMLKKYIKNDDKSATLLKKKKSKRPEQFRSLKNDSQDKHSKSRLANRIDRNNNQSFAKNLNGDTSIEIDVTIPDEPMASKTCQSSLMINPQVAMQPYLTPQASVAQLNINNVATNILTKQKDSGLATQRNDQQTNSIISTPVNSSNNKEMQNLNKIGQGLMSAASLKTLDTDQSNGSLDTKPHCKVLQTKLSLGNVNEPTRQLELAKFAKERLFQQKKQTNQIISFGKKYNGALTPLNKRENLKSIGQKMQKYQSSFNDGSQSRTTQTQKIQQYNSFQDQQDLSTIIEDNPIREREVAGGKEQVSHDIKKNQNIRANSRAAQNISLVGGKERFSPDIQRNKNSRANSRAAQNITPSINLKKKSLNTSNTPKHFLNTSSPLKKHQLSTFYQSKKVLIKKVNNPPKTPQTVIYNTFDTNLNTKGKRDTSKIDQMMKELNTSASNLISSRPQNQKIKFQPLATKQSESNILKLQSQNSLEVVKEKSFGVREQLTQSILSQKSQYKNTPTKKPHSSVDGSSPKSEEKSQLCPEQKYLKMLAKRQLEEEPKNKGKNEYKIDFGIYMQTNHKSVFDLGGASSLSTRPETRKALQRAQKPLCSFPVSMNYTTMSEYEQLGFLGQGTFAYVRQAVHKQTGYPVAIKIYEKIKLGKNKEMKKSISREITLLGSLSGTCRKGQDEQTTAREQQDVSLDTSKVSNNSPERPPLNNSSIEFGYGHPNIMRLFDAIDTPRQLYLVMESVKGRILLDILKWQPRKLLPERTAAKIFGQVIEALVYFHERKIAHRDLKPENLIVSLEEGCDPECKVIDFGFATNASKKLQIQCGTPYYMSPEIAGEKSYNGLSSDMWAAGIILFEMLFGYHPFDASNENELLKRVRRGKLVLPQIKHEKIPNDKEKQDDETSSEEENATTIEKFENYPEIENTILICNLLTDILQVNEKNRASAHQIRQKYSIWLKGNF